MADADDKQASAQVWGAAVVVASALAVVAAYLINGAPLVLAVAGVETVLLMVHVGRRWRALHGAPAPAGHRPRRGIPDAAHCERCRRAREALDARQVRGRSAGAARPEPPARAAHREHEAGTAHREREGHAAYREHDERREYGAHPGDGAHRTGEAHDGRERHQDPAPQPEPGAADHPPYPRRPQIRAPYERPWTAERAAARSVDRSTARRGAPGSAGRAVRHQ
ncbi:hypothetical protein ACFV0O_32875 [Kitasatospora sp. NPDC059577]|uniref:hypothetical protein n=1 Tax=Kitasatospora sp. NPDC059577 TaxID=3346873 RepID=UPI0036843E62